MAAVEIKLSAPIEHKGEKVESLSLDFDKLTGADVENAAIDAQSVSPTPIVVLVTNAHFHAQIASRACGLPVAVLHQLTAPDYLAVLTRCQGFLVGTG